MDELALTVAESKVANEDIKDYVLEHSGLKASNFCVAQIKRKCGINERGNYNKGKIESSKQSQCLSKKENSIE